MDVATLLQTVGGLLVAISLALSGWALKSIVDLSIRMARNEAADIEYRKAVERRITDLAEMNQRSMKSINEVLVEMKQNLVALHKRMDSFMEASRKDRISP